MKQASKQPQRPWILHLTEEQFDTIIRGVEYYHRMMCGQVEEVVNVCPHIVDESTLLQLKKEMFPELSYAESYGWDGSRKGDYFDLEMARSYQIYREMLHQQEIRKPLDMLGNVYRRETLHTEKADKLIVKRINE